MQYLATARKYMGLNGEVWQDPAKESSYASPIGLYNLLYVNFSNFGRAVACIEAIENYDKSPGLAFARVQIRNQLATMINWAKKFKLVWPDLDIKTFICLDSDR